AGMLTAAEAEMWFQTGPFTGSAYTNAPQAIFTRYDLQNVRAYGYPPTKTVWNIVFGQAAR
ncbi:MAG: hypothetical protein ACO2ZG_07585, partial [Flavobacteriaceae bacterium]